MSRILDNLYLGSYADAKNQSLLTNLGITHIVTAGVELRPLYPKNFKYFYIPAFDSPDYKLNVYFDETGNFIHNALEKENGKVLVHCHWGISRSTTIVLAYLIKHHNMSPFEAKVFVKQRRSIIYPNEGFIRQIEAYAKKYNRVKIDKSPKGFERNASRSFYDASSPKRMWPLTEVRKDRKVESKSSMKSTNNIFSNERPKTNHLKNQPLFGYNTSIGFTKDIFSGNQSLKLDYAKPRVTFAETPQPKKSYNQDIKDLVEKKGNTLPQVKTKEESKEYESKPKIHEYHCKDCKIKVFDSFDIIHNSDEKCNHIYLRFMQWMGFAKGNVSKIFCPNSKCNVILGYINQNGGKCSCGKIVDRMFVIYPVKVSNNKLRVSSNSDF